MSEQVHGRDQVFIMHLFVGMRLRNGRHPLLNNVAFEQDRQSNTDDRRTRAKAHLFDTKKI